MAEIGKTAIPDMSLSRSAAIEILKASSEAIVVVDDTGEIVLANSGAEALFGYEPGELTGERIEILLPEALREKHVRQRRRYADAPRSRPLVSGLNLTGQRKDGAVFEAEIALTPIQSKDGLLISSAIRDISADNTSEAYFRNVLESAPDAMVIIDHHGRIAVVNGQAEKMFGYAREALLGREIEMLLPERVRSRHVAHRAGFSGEPKLRPMGIGMELAGRRSDGSEFPVEISLSPFTSASGAFISSVIRDVTERKQMERELIDARHTAERANKANTAFLAAASHDLRQPVQAMNLLNGALRRTVDQPVLLEMVESQQQSLDAMTNLLNSLLDISRLDAGKVEPEFDEFPVQRLVDRLYAEFGRQARHKKLDFSADRCDTVVRSDPNLLSEILQNFVSNAIRYTPAGSVRLTCTRDKDVLWLGVSDSGIGIDADDIEAIFQEYHQLRTPGMENEGFGLGLAIVRRLADLLGHEIRVESVPGKGSTFAIRLPVVASVANEDEHIEVQRDHAAPTGGTVMLVEDDMNVAKAWSLLLKSEGYAVITAASAAETATVIQSQESPPDLIISDYHLLDGSTGVEAVALVRERFAAEIPAFIVTGDTSKLVDDARAIVNCAIMNKPVDTDELLRQAASASATGRVPKD